MKCRSLPLMVGLSTLSLTFRFTNDFTRRVAEELLVAVVVQARKRVADGTPSVEGVVVQLVVEDALDGLVELHARVERILSQLRQVHDEPATLIGGGLVVLVLAIADVEAICRLEDA
eukprot:scaffold1330_cov240-Pinguiococcus_pyrenoidosus.AAC.16